MRAANELFIRKFLEGTSDEAGKRAAIVYLVMQRSFETTTYLYPKEVYYPVCASVTLRTIERTRDPRLIFICSMCISMVSLSYRCVTQFGQI